MKEIKWKERIYTKTKDAAKKKINNEETQSSRLMKNSSLVHSLILSQNATLHVLISLFWFKTNYYRKDLDHHPKNYMLAKILSCQSSNHDSN